jgi:hypothetical protein
MHDRGRQEELLSGLLEKFEETHVELVAAVFKHEDQLRDSIAGVIDKNIDDVVDESKTCISVLGVIIQSITQKGFYPVLSALSTLWEKLTEDETLQHTVEALDTDIKAISSKFMQDCEATDAGGDTPSVLVSLAEAIQEADFKEEVKQDMRRYLLERLGRTLDGEETYETGLSADQVRAVVDPAELSESICTNIAKVFADAGKLSFLLCELTRFVERIEENRPFSKEVRQSFPTESMILKSLLSSIQHKEVAILETIGAGNHCNVYKGKRGSMICAARGTIEEEISQDFKEMAKTYAMFR